MLLTHLDSCRMELWMQYYMLCYFLLTALTILLIGGGLVESLQKKMAEGAEEIKKLQEELVAARAERDAAQRMCLLIEGHYRQLLESTVKGTGQPHTRSVRQEALPSDMSPQGTPQGSSSVQRPAAKGTSGIPGGLPVPFPTMPDVTVGQTDSKEAPTLSLGLLDEQESRATARGWLQLDTSKCCEVVLLTDSLYRCVDPHSLPGDVELFCFPGMRSNELLEILFHNFWCYKVRVNTLLLCVGTNDYVRPETTAIIKNIRNCVRLASEVARTVIVCTVPESRWKQQKSLRFSYRDIQRPRALLNREIRKMAIDQVALLDLDDIFAGHRGLPGDVGPGWYHSDSVHPNTRGTIALEICLGQLLRGEKVIPPKHYHRRLCPGDDNALVSEQSRRAALNKANRERVKPVSE